MTEFRHNEKKFFRREPNSLRDGLMVESKLRPQLLGKGRMKILDKQTFTELVLEAEDTLYRVAWSILRNNTDAQDAVQEAVLRAWEKLDSLRETRYFRTWLTRILIRECYRLRRAGSVLLPLEELPETAAPGRGEIWRELQALPEALRLPVVLHYIEGYSVSETGTLLRLPTGTVKSRLSRARGILRLELEGLR